MKSLFNYLFNRMRMERLLGLLYGPLYRCLFRSIGKGSTISPFIFSLNLDCVSVGSNSIISRHTRVLALKGYGVQKFLPRMSIGNNVSVGHGCTLSCVNNIQICDDVTIGDKVYIADSTHAYADIAIGIREQPLEPGEVYIGRGAWLGYGAFLSGNVSVGEHAIVGANSVVTKPVEPYTVVAGVPAKPIKKYNPDSKVWERIGD